MHVIEHDKYIIFVRSLEIEYNISFKIRNKMKKIILLVAVATTISFAACTNTQSAEQTEEVATENVLDAVEVETEEVVDSVEVDAETVEAEVVEAE